MNTYEWFKTFPWGSISEVQKRMYPVLMFRRRKVRPIVAVEWAEELAMAMNKAGVALLAWANQQDLPTWDDE